jgi:DNA helicase-2/ATP-dependent DNA helicase PcrA
VTPSAVGVAARPHRPEELRDLLGIPFSDEQIAAATAPLAPGLVVAGAGSGKTAVMAARVVWAVATGAVQPQEVLGLTFTNKAAGELAGRVRAGLERAGLLATGGGPDDPADGGEPTVSTYHAYAGRLVAEHALRIGVEPQSRLLADATRFQLAARVLRSAPGPFRHLSRPLSMLVEDLLALDGELSEHLVDPEQLRRHDLELEAELLGVTKEVKDHRDALAAVRTRRELLVLVEAYRRVKRERDLLDFGDQVAIAARLAVERPEVGAAERARYRLVVLDEYQDTSVAQRRLLAGLFGGGHAVTAVGDPCQAIYGWRGASVSNIERFPAHFACADGRPAARFPLTVNRRSGGRLLQVANSVAAALLERHRQDALRPEPAQRQAGETVVALHETVEDELAWVADRIEEAITAGTPPGEVAVLVRARSDFAPLHATLVARGIPVEVVGLGGLLSLPEVGDVVATLEVLDEPTSNAALLRLLTGPRWRLGARDLVALGQRARQLAAPAEGGGDASDVDDRREAAGDGSDDPATGGPATDVPVTGDPATDLGPDPEEALESAVAGVDPVELTALSEALERPGRAGWSEEGLRRVALLATELRGLRRHLGEPLLDLVHRVVRTTGLDVELAASPAARAARRRESLAAFLDQVAAFADLDGDASVTAFLAFLRAAQEHERGLDRTVPSGADAVQVMTVHKSKGLEWDVVVVPDLTRGVFPATTLRDRWTRAAHVLPSPLRGDADDLPALPGLTSADFKDFDAELKAHLEREERRLGYVAFTRARTRLLASGHWWGPTQKRPRGPSPFLAELKALCDDGLGRVDVWADPPPEEAPSPVLARAVELAWPAGLQPDDLARRREAAAAVRAQRDRLPRGLLPGTEVLADLAATRPGARPRLGPEEAARVAAWDRDLGLLLAEARESGRDRGVVDLPRGLTATQMVRLARDPDGLAREIARPMPRPPAPGARRGTRFHAWVETLFQQRPLLDPDELPGAGDADIADDADLLALQAAFLTSPYAHRTPLQVEAPFSLVLAGRVIRGRIDAVYDAGGGRFEVVDWKTGHEPADPLQLAVYRLAWARLRGVEPGDVDGVFLHVRSGEVMRPDLPDEAELVRLLTGGR